MGADFFPEGGKNASKIVIPQKISLGEGIDTFCSPRGGVEGGKGGGTNHVFAEENKDFRENMRKKSKVFKQHKSHLFT